jgi:hypothetical protein
MNSPENQFPVSARHEHRAERSEREGIPAAATKRSGNTTSIRSKYICKFHRSYSVQDS